MFIISIISKLCRGLAILRKSKIYHLIDRLIHLLSYETRKKKLGNWLEDEF